MPSPTKKCVLHPDKPATMYPHKVKHPAQLAQWLCDECWDKANKNEIDLMALQRGELK